MHTSFDWSKPVLIWWFCLSLVALFNIILWFISYKLLKNFHKNKVLVFLSGLYVFGCAFRSFLPRADVQRLCIFDTWFSNVLLGRSVATMAELAFIVQWAIVLNFLSRSSHSKKIQFVSYCIVPLIIVAECFSWYAVITTNYLGNTVEESLWALTYLIIGLSLLNLLKSFHSLRMIMTIAAIGCFLYFLFMISIDVPMYFNRWQADLIEQKPLMNFAQGINDLNTRWVVSHSTEEWRQEMPWMSLYFSVAVWVSIGLSWFPKLLSDINRQSDEKSVY